MAAAMHPEIAAEAPIIGCRSPTWVTRCAMAPAAAVTTQKPRKRNVPNRRAIGEPNASSHTPLTER
jgi:hypothetical protein